MKRLNPVPKHLSAASAALWESILDRYELEDQHVALLQLALESLDRAEQARIILAAEGIVLTGARGGAVAHPAVGIERDSRIAALRGFRELGLSEYGDDVKQARDGKGRFDA